MFRRSNDLPAEVLEEVMDGVPPPPPGVKVTYNAAGEVTDVQLDPQEFDGPDGVPAGWYDEPGDKAGNALAMLGAGVVLMGLSGLVTVGCIAGLFWWTR